MKTITLRNACPLNLLLLSWLLFLSIPASTQEIATMTTETWDADSWAPLSQTANTYDDNNYLLTATSQNWDSESLTWENSIKIEYTNNPNGSVSQTLVHMWDDSEEQWLAMQRIIYTYTTADEIETAITEILAGGIWMPMSQVVYEYDASDYLINQTSQMSDFMGGWTNSSRTLYENNPSGTVDIMISQAWDAVGSIWQNSSRTTYTYNGEDIMTELNETWVSGSWVNSERSSYSYSSGDLASILVEQWDSDLTAWQNTSLSSMTNNPDGSLQQVIYQSWDGSGWLNEMRITFTYNPLAVGEFERISFTAYPVPARDVVQLASSQSFGNIPYEIVDMHGKTLLRGNFVGPETSVDVSSLSSGVFFVRMYGEISPLRIVKN